MIEEGKKKLSWWGTVEPILIGQASTPTPAPAAPRPMPSTPPASTSAEVSISRGSEGMSTGPKKTSLQF